MDSSTAHILGLSGSLRKRSYNTALLRAAADIAPDDMKVEIFPLAGMPMFNADLEAEGHPREVSELRAAIAASDALLIATPEYNWSTTAVLKNAIDWISRRPDSPLNGKPAAILGAGGRFGTLRAQLHLREILAHNQVRLVASPQVYVDTPDTRFDDDLRLHNDKFRRQVERLLLALGEIIAES